MPSRNVFLAGFTALALAFSVSHSLAETLNGALAKAYQNNSTLNYERAGLRAFHENVPQAKSGMRPTISLTGLGDVTSTNLADIRAGEFGIDLSQQIFDGFRTRNNTLSAEAAVRARQAALRNVELNILFDAAAVYMDVIRARQIAALRAQNIGFLQEQLRSATSRFEVGEGTRTDVAQAQAAEQIALATLAGARAEARAAEARYRQVVGEDPGSLQMPDPLRRFLPNGMESALSVALNEHPAIVATLHLVDSTSYAVKSAEGALLPSLSATAGLRATWEDRNGVESDGHRAQVGLRLSVPIYQGGLASSQVRQSKEELGQARIEVDVSRDEVRRAVAAAWAGYQAAIESVRANREAVSAARLALSGIMEERDVGQRTTLDVLRGQEDVINAQISLINAQREVVVASYAIASAMGRLSAENLGLQVAHHRPEEHYNAVKDKWFGLRTPDGR